MSAIPLRQRTPTEIVDAALQIYRLEPLVFLTASALIYVPWIVVQLAFGITGNPTEKLSLTAAIVAALGTVVVYIFVGGVTTIIASDVYFARQPDVARAFKTVVKRVNGLGGAMFMSGLFIFIGFIFLFVPGLYLACRFFCVRQAVLLENTAAIDALKRSAKLSEDIKWHIFVTVFITWILVVALTLGGQVVVHFIPSSIVTTILGTLLAAVVYPFYGIVETILYYDARIRREGFDVEYLASEAIAGDATSAAAI
ncbi:MAG: hypothetical protein ABI442_11495 [Gemmatimonadaceae bacterium]